MVRLTTKKEEPFLRFGSVEQCQKIIGWRWNCQGNLEVALGFDLDAGLPDLISTHRHRVVLESNILRLPRNP